MDKHTIKHLEIIQNAITRMANNSFLLKGWTITLISALFALSAKDSDPDFVYLLVFPCIIFWGLDTYYLRQERLFRKLYDGIRKDEITEPFTMNTTLVSSQVQSWLRTAFSVSEAPFYGSILVIIALGFILLPKIM